jgi:N-acetyl-gamma-glutamyl-phosphate reductase/acetylglutamate kinase
MSAELYSRDAIRKSTRISNPGCYSTNTQLILAPLLPYIAPGSQPTIFGVSGYSGAGTKSGNVPKITPEDLRGAIRPYALTDHIHEREAAYHLAGLMSQTPSEHEVPFSLGFIPHVAPWFQGIISTASIHLKESMRAEDVRKLFEEKYKGEKLLKVQKEVPDVADIFGKHGWTVGGFQIHSGGKRAVIVVS